MTGSFDAEARRILRAGEENGGLTRQSLFDLVVAAHDESVETAASLAQRVADESEETRTALARIYSHLESESGRTEACIRRVEATVAGREEAIETAKAEVIREIEQRKSWPVLDAALVEMRDLVRRAPRRGGDPLSVDYSAEDAELSDIRRAWRGTTWVTKIVVGAIVTALVGMSMALLAQSVTIEQRHAEPEPAPTVTVTASPTR